MFSPNQIERAQEFHLAARVAVLKAELADAEIELAEFRQKIHRRDAE